MSHTIFAISTPVGIGGIGIIRVSGDDALKAASAVFCVKGVAELAKTLTQNPLKLHFGTISGIGFKDKGYVVYFPAGKSFTGEDTIEFYLHGGVRIMQGTLKTLSEKGLYPAEAGEFTKRAYLNGRMSLSDAEGIADMINAQSASALRAAFRLMQGGLSGKCEDLSERLLTVISTLEASLDYPDEMEDEIMPSINGIVPDVIADIDKLLSTVLAGRLAKYGVNVAIVGAPNAGKSSLMNALLNEDRSIVTEIAGTTRDTVTGSLECDGVKINLTDTAGLRESEDVVESAGIRRALKALKGADIVLYVVDTTTKSENEQSKIEELASENATVITVYNKCDISGYKTDEKNAYAISALSGEGVQNLLKRIAAECNLSVTADEDIITSERHVSALKEAKSSLESAIVKNEATIDCVLIDLRDAYDSLGKITGRTATEDIVNSIFTKFCVGK